MASAWDANDPGATTEVRWPARAAAAAALREPELCDGVYTGRSQRCGCAGWALRSSAGSTGSRNYARGDPGRGGSLGLPSGELRADQPRGAEAGGGRDRDPDAASAPGPEHGLSVISVSSDDGGNCQKSLGGNNFYVKGFIDIGSFQFNGSGDLGYNYTDYDGNAGTGVYAQAPAPDCPGLAGPANQAGAALIGFGGQAAINFFITNIALSAAGEFVAVGIRLGLDAAALSTTADIAGEASQISRALTPIEKRAVEGVLKQIENGTTKGSPYDSFNGVLPSKPLGYYRRYTAPLSGQTGRGTSLVVLVLLERSTILLITMKHFLHTIDKQEA